MNTLSFMLGVLLGTLIHCFILFSEFPSLVRYVIASQLLTIPSSSRNEQLLDLLFFHVLNPAMVTEELIDHVQRKLEKEDARLTTKCFTSLDYFLSWKTRFGEGRFTAPLADQELRLNDMPEEYQKDYEIFVKTFYERLEIKKQGGEFATKETYKKLGALKSIWTEKKFPLKDNKEKIHEGACDAADKMEKGLSDHPEKTFFSTVTIEKR